MPASSRIDASDVLRHRGDREARDDHFLASHVGQIFSPHEGRMNAPGCLPLFLVQRRLRKKIRDTVGASGVDQALKRCLALGTLDARQKMLLLRQGPEIRTRTEFKIYAGNRGSRCCGLACHRRLQINAPFSIVVLRRGKWG